MDNSTILKFLCIIGIQICFDQQNGCLNIYGAISWIFCAMPFVNPSFSKKCIAFSPFNQCRHHGFYYLLHFLTNHLNTWGLPPSLFPEKEKKNPTQRMLDWVTYLFGVWILWVMMVSWITQLVDGSSYDRLVARHPWTHWWFIVYLIHEE